jgi:small-conductance mechanosensitive channel
MHTRHRIMLSVALALTLCQVQRNALEAEESAPAAVLAPRPHLAVLTDDEVMRVLDDTLAWYRTLGIQQQSVSEPSDLLILYANRQTADKVINTSFAIARANAELLSNEASAAATAAAVPDNSAVSSQNLKDGQQDLEKQRQSLQTEIGSAQHRVGSAGRIAELQAELDMVNARRNLLDTMTQFVNDSDAARARVSALKAHIEALAASIPAANAGNDPRSLPRTSSAVSNDAATSSNLPGVEDIVPERSGIWDLAFDAYLLSRHISSIDAIDRRTQALEDTFRALQGPSVSQLRDFSAQSTALAAQADHASGGELITIRNQIDTLAWLFKQTSDILIPLNEEGVLLQQYRHELGNWRDALRRQRADAVSTLALRLGILAIMLAIVFLGGELWRRAVMRYTLDAHRRYQQLLIQRLAVWIVAVIITAVTMISHLSSFATFAGLLSAGAAVALQGVLVSIVGYFFLIGKYGIRIGDRVQIGAVTGEVIYLGLVRMHLMELTSQEPPGPTGRVVDFANSIVFQASGGLFKQINGVNFSWRETRLQLPAGSDYIALQERLLAAVRGIVEEQQAEILQQTTAIKAATASSSVETPSPHVQLQISATGVEAVIRYPVPLRQAAEVQQRVSRELLDILVRERAGGALSLTP